MTDKLNIKIIFLDVEPSNSIEVFANASISTICVLNDRKVMT